MVPALPDDCQDRTITSIGPDALTMEPLTAHAGTCTNLARSLLAEGRPDQAIAVYRQAVDLWPDSAEIWNALGAALCDRGLADQAVVAFGRAVALRPDSAATHNNLGLACKIAG